MACVVIDGHGQILLLKRSPEKRIFPNKWAVVSAGPLESKDDRRLIALREIKDELGIEGEVLKEGRETVIIDNHVEWHVKWFLAGVATHKIRLNHEHTEYKWVFIDGLTKYDTIEGTGQMILELLAE